VPAFDGFRAYAILGIVLFHLSGSTSLVDRELTRAAIYALLPSMIEVLFIVSGFVVFLPVVVRRGSLGNLREPSDSLPPSRAPSYASPPIADSEQHSHVSHTASSVARS
jgi:hypothetical protein